MASTGTAFQKGGGGTNFEQHIQAALVTTMLVKGSFPGLGENEIQRIVFQSSNYDWATDDILVETQNNSHTHKILIQAKHNLTFSPKDNVFKEVIAAFWTDYNNPNFSKANDRLIIAKNALNNTERNHIKTILNYAKSHSSADDFFTEVGLVEEKTRKLSVFKETIALVESQITNEQLWLFLKCVDLIGYDFINQTSIDEAYFLNLIRLTKSPHTGKSEKDIWNEIVQFISKMNPDGGSVTKESIISESFYRNFNITSLEVAFRSIRKLENDGDIFLSSISNAIGFNPEFHINRTECTEKFLDLFSESNFCIITGRPGVGKSAFVKEILAGTLRDYARFVFRADQLNRPTLAATLSELGIKDSLVDVFSCLSLNTNRVIFIDSLEKLLEDPDSTNAFKQLVLLSKKNNIKIVATARIYAVELILQKFDIPYNESIIFGLPELTDSELLNVSSVHKVLLQPLKNSNIRQLLLTPKYLDFTLKALNQEPDDLMSVTIGQFKDKLWRSLVRNENFRSRGLPSKREKTFMNIAVKRAIEMRLFANASGQDEEVLDLLENDDIIFQDGKGRYAPTHDILEDWALIKYVEQKYDDLHNTGEFFKEIGNEPAIRRGFRLWVEDCAVENFQRIIPLVRLCIEDNTIENYWRDELLTALFRADSGGSFFSEFKPKLLEANGQLLNECLILIRTSCRERTSLSNHEIFLPYGSGWKAALIFISEHLVETNGSRSMILKFMDHYEYRLIFQYPKDKQELVAVKKIALFFIAQITDLQKFWHYEERSDAHQSLVIDILFAVVPIAKDEITSLVEEAIKDEEEQSYRLDQFYERVLEKFLSGVRSQRLALLLPDFLINVAWKQWKYVPPTEDETSEDQTSYRYESSWPDSPKCWGIADKRAFFPPGVYKTPLSNLLAYWPKKGLRFAINFINYVVEFYVQSKCRYKHELSEIDLVLNDGSTVKQWGGWEFWVAYRGLSVTHYLIESLLVSLEGFLLNLADKEDEKSRTELRQHFNYVLRSSNSVMPTAVLASVTMANPQAVGEEWLPMVTIKQMYDWEIKRPLIENRALAMYDQRIPSAQQERSRSNKLPHRVKYRGGFGGFLVDYQLTIGVVNQQLRAIFDKMWQDANPSDILWRKRLHEIDTRKWTASEVDGSIGQFVIQPKYESSVESYVDAHKDSVDAAESASKISLDLAQVLADQKILELSKWEEYLIYFTKLEKTEYKQNRPVSFAVITLEDFADKLDEKTVEWCATTLIDGIWSFIAMGRPDMDIEVSFSILEKEVILRSFSTLRNTLTNEEDINGLVFLICYTFISLPNHELNDFAKEYRNSFAVKHPDLAENVWGILILLAQFRKANPPQMFYGQIAGGSNYAEKEFEYLTDLCNNRDDLRVDLGRLTFADFDSNTLLLASLTIHNATSDEQYILFTHTIIGLIQNHSMNEDNSNKRHRRSRSKNEIDHHILLYVEAYFAETLLQGDLSIARNILDSIVTPAFKIKKSDFHDKIDAFKFSQSVLYWLVYKIDDVENNNTDTDEQKHLINQFWQLWNHLFKLIAKSKKRYMTSILLLNTEVPWPIDQDHSAFLDNRIFDYQMYVDKYGDTNLESVIKFLSTVGRKYFLLNGLTWIAKHLKTNSENTKNLNLDDCERIARYLSANHMADIKGDQSMLSRFLYFLDTLVALGSSYAYLVRENVMTYKTYK
jgi:hypothetical protein